MKGKKLMALMLTGSLAVSMLAACGQSEGSSVGSGSEGSGSAGNETSEESEAASGAGDEASSGESDKTGEKSSAEGTEGGDYNVTWEDIAEITVLYPSMSTIPSGLGAVEAAINEITEAEINTHVTLEMLEMGSYEQQVNLMISSGETIDLMITMPTGAASFTTMTSQNQLMDLTDLLDEYAPRAVAAVGDFMAGTQVNGKTMALTTYKSFVSGIYINMRTDVLEDLGLVEAAQNMKSFSDYEAILEAVKNSGKWNYLAGVTADDANGNVLPNVTSLSYAENFEDITSIDNLGDTLAVVGVLLNQEEPEVVTTFDTDALKFNYELVKRWYDKGYVYKDSPTTKEAGTSLIRSDAVFSNISFIEVGSESSSDINCGMDMTSVQITTVPITTGTCTKFTWAVPTTAKEPEAAVTFLEMMFNDARIANLFAWGIEGIDYEVDDNGVAHYIEGNEEPAYHAVDFLNANRLIVLPWEGDAPDSREYQASLMENPQVSPYFGFSCDSTEVSSEISAVSSVLSEYKPQLGSGVAADGTLEAFREKLDSVNVDKIADFYQTELDAWMEAK